MNGEAWDACSIWGDCIGNGFVQETSKRGETSNYEGLIQGIYLYFKRGNILYKGGLNNERNISHNRDRILET